jgi:hypothetical protein
MTGSRESIEANDGGEQARPADVLALENLQRGMEGQAPWRALGERAPGVHLTDTGLFRKVNLFSIAGARQPQHVLWRETSTALLGTFWQITRSRLACSPPSLCTSPVSESQHLYGR